MMKMMKIKIQIPNINVVPLHVKGEYKLKITIPRLVLRKKVPHNSRYMSYNDEMHSQK